MKRKEREEALAQLIVQDKEHFYRLAYSYVKNQQDALDVVQDSIHKALRGVHRLEKEANLRNWYIRILINTAIDKLRKQKREVLIDQATLEGMAPSSNDSYKNVDLEQVLQQLSPKYRIVIVLKYFEDLTLREVAEVLDISENTAKTRLYRALNLLRELMKEATYMGGHF
ncbi:RNA polymerase sigma factor SigV [Paenibacillus montaniterrae]|uniref:RNA polymerase sigma factor SigV n=1 Tax=Paenibacillus montaniterrae TaxID=429341 RepID=A0A919YUT3_9BACL|nr:sigma-70 family RNA polymerase sigma factor [Paenibacillus montaniterrae]GIP18514.1 RNA polymerase sigma factor SigV [Paenibacillus montaniterrae]